MKTLIGGIIVFAIIVSIGAPGFNIVSANSSLIAERSISGSMCPGSTVTVTINLEVTSEDGGVYGLGISDDISSLPDDWTVTPNDGGILTDDGKIEYVWFDLEGNLGDKTVTYDITIPDTATIGSSYTITGEAYIVQYGKIIVDIDGEDTITVVECEEPLTFLAAERSISGSMCPGSTVTVTINLEVTSEDGGVYGLGISDDISSLPDDWTVTPNDGGILTDDGKIEYVWFDPEGGLGDKTVTYDITIPDTATIGSSYTITGEAYITPEGTVDIDGEDTITVVECSSVCPDADFILTLKPGWNFVSIPKPITPKMNAVELFDLSEGEMAFYYNASVGILINDQIMVKPCQGYLVYKDIEEDQQICIYYDRDVILPPPSEKLWREWNLIGHIDDTTWTVEEFLSVTGLQGKCSILATLSNQGLQEFDIKYCYPSSPRLSEFDQIIPGYGYLVYLTEETTMPGTIT